ncbi:acyl-CoA dehydrogenase [Jatrophihabitans sp. YIM 134969]
MPVTSLHPPGPATAAAHPVPEELPELLRAAAHVGDDAAAAVRLAASWGGALPLPGGAGTAARFSILRAVARENLTAARALEAHTDALAILAEAGDAASTDHASTDLAWGVFAAEGPGTRVTARSTAEGGFRLDGVKPWCSLAALLDRALVTAHVEGGRRLFAVDLHATGVEPAPPQTWAARGLTGVVSAPVRFTDVPATPVGEPGWYLERPGFAWGGIGVAACWSGGVDGLVDTLHRASFDREGDLAALHVGVADAALHAADTVLADAAARIASGRADGDDGRVLALRVRAVVADTVERVLTQVGHALGPAPLAFDPDHARRVADLTLYVRQHHAERDLAALGATLLGQERG